MDATAKNTFIGLKVESISFQDEPVISVGSTRLPGFFADFRTGDEANFIRDGERVRDPATTVYRTPN